MLPEAIEMGRTGQSLAIEADFIGCQQGFNGPQVMVLIEKVLSKTSFNGKRPANTVVTCSMPSAS